MASKSSSKKSAEPKLVDDETAVPTRVEVRVGPSIVYAQDLFGANVSSDENGVQVSGSTERPKIKASEAETQEYDPTTDEPIGANTVTPYTDTTVPVPDPRDTEEIIEQFHDGSRE